MKISALEKAIIDSNKKLESATARKHEPISLGRSIQRITDSDWDFSGERSTLKAVIDGYDSVINK